jgi:hypothetical protein
MFGLPLDDNEQEDASKTDYKINLLSRFKIAYENLVLKKEKAVNDYKFKYDLKHKKIVFKEGEQVMVFWPVPKKGFSQKLLPKWDGPYKIVKQLGAVTYRVQKERKTFCVHVQRLQHYDPWLKKTQ